MDLKLKELKVLVSGSSRGLGASIVKAFLNEGAFVTMCSRSQKAMSKTASSYGPLRDRLFCHKVDASVETSVNDCVQASVKQMGGLDILVNNVGGATKFAGFFDLNSDDWSEHFQLNVMSMVSFSREAYPYLKKSKAPKIINISSLTGLQPGLFNPHYSVCKAATINLSKHLANIFAKDRIIVNCVAPGPFKSDSWSRHIKCISNEEQLSIDEVQEREFLNAAKAIPLDRIGSPEDITPIILLLASSVSQWTTGGCFVIDGGKMKTI